MADPKAQKVAEKTGEVFKAFDRRFSGLEQTQKDHGKKLDDVIRTLTSVANGVNTLSQEMKNFSEGVNSRFIRHRQRLEVLEDARGVLEKSNDELEKRVGDLEAARVA